MARGVVAILSTPPLRPLLLLLLLHDAFSRRPAFLPPPRRTTGPFIFPEKKSPLMYAPPLFAPKPGWFAKPEYTTATLYEEIIKKCETNSCGQDALFMICKLANNPQEARIVLNAFAAVRASLVRQGKFKPYGERLAVEFVN
ncbi:hypothetical protein VOLCADRAFT_116268, partial [Volvox carteri f. nagariensis]